MAGEIKSGKRIYATLPISLAGYNSLNEPDMYGKYTVDYVIDGPQVKGVDYKKVRAGVKAALVPAIEKACSAFEKAYPSTSTAHLTSDAGIKQIIEKLIREYKPDNKAKVKKIMRFGMKHKTGISRKTGEPYTIDPSIWGADGKPSTIVELTGSQWLPSAVSADGIPTLIKPVVTVSVWSGAASGGKPAITVQLKGVVVAMAARFSGSKGAVDVQDVDIAALEEAYGYSLTAGDEETEATTETDEGSSDEYDPFA